MKESIKIGSIKKEEKEYGITDIVFTGIIIYKDGSMFVPWEVLLSPQNPSACSMQTIANILFSIGRM